jgi:hypothetical protein
VSGQTTAVETMRKWLWWLVFGGLLIAALAYILYIYVFHYPKRGSAT